MPNVIIVNPILNSPYREPTRDWKFSDDGITDEIVDERWVSAYFVPIAKPRSRGQAAGQLTFQSEWTQDRLEENRFINEVRPAFRPTDCPALWNTTTAVQRMGFAAAGEAKSRTQAKDELADLAAKPPVATKERAGRLGKG